ncbi:MAG TPA: hypothetical protein GXZ29_02960 [Clostridiales bacterium]|jgi:hypothetical protein|nr:hypothetical protein [Clostridiales bacterium]
MIEELQDLFPHENYADFDRVRRLKWCNNTILYAIEYYRVVLNIKTDFDLLINDMKDGKLQAVISLLYGALRAVDTKVDITEFGRIYKPGNITQYINVVVEGLEAYLPEPEILDHGQNLDESWPDTQSEIRKKGIIEKTDWGFWYWFARSKAGMTTEEFGNTTLRALMIIYKRYWKDHGIDMYKVDDGSWL